MPATDHLRRADWAVHRDPWLGADLTTEAGEPRRPDGLALAVLGVCFGWLLLALIAMLVSSGPNLGPVDSSAQHLIVGIVLALVVAGAVAVTTGWRPATVGWAAVLVACCALLLFELLQLTVPVRSFQWSDLSFGVTGVTIGGLGAAAASNNRRRFTTGVAGLGGLALLVSAVLLVALPSDQLSGTFVTRLGNCSDDESRAATDWDLAVLELRNLGSGCVGTGAGVLVPFGSEIRATDSGANAGVVLNDGGLVSAPLVGLADALRGQNAVTFGIRFTTEVTSDDTVPVVLARLTVDQDPAKPVTQLLQRGPHLTANIGSGEPVVGIGLPLANRARAGTPQELVMTYGAGVGIAYLNGEVISEGRTDPFTFEFDGELSLEVGWRVDERWQPLNGEVLAIIIADRALELAEVATAFDAE